MTKYFRGIQGTAVQSSTAQLCESQLMAAVPSLFAVDKHESRSDRYTCIPTIDVLRGLQREGFEPFFAVQSKVRDQSRREFTKHMLRLRHRDMIAAGNQQANEIIIVNSHDGASAYHMLAGVFRFVCQNGMIAGDMVDNVKVRHSGDVVGQVIEGAYEVVNEFDRVNESRELMQGTQVPLEAQLALATGALEFKYGSDEEGRLLSPVRPADIIKPRRTGDVGDDLWRAFNRMQENLIKGGQVGFTASDEGPRTGRRTRTRAVTGIDQDVKLNRALWTMAEALRTAIA